MQSHTGPRRATESHRGTWRGTEKPQSHGEAREGHGGSRRAKESHRATCRATERRRERLRAAKSHVELQEREYRYRFVSLRSPCKGTHHRLDTLRSPIMETYQVVACWALAKRRCPPPFRQTLSLRGLCQAEPTWSFIADHEHSLLARLVALATPKIHHSLGSMRERADHGSA